MEFLDQLKPLLDWLHLHPGWAGFITFLISLSESLAVIGLFIPGTVVMTAIGTLIGAGIIPAWQTIAWAIAGAIVGDSLSYRLGYHFTEHLRDLWPFSRYPQILTKGEGFFKKHGGKSVLLGRFVGPVRPVIPVVAGMMKMRPRHFLISNVLSAVLWAPFYMLPGILIGAASLELSPQATTHFIITVVAILVALWLAVWLCKVIVYRLLRFLDYRVQRLWESMRAKPGCHGLVSLLENTQNPASHAQLTRSLVALLALALLLFLVIAHFHFDWLSDINNSTDNFVTSLHQPLLNKIMVMMTFIGYRWVLFPLCVVISLYLIYKHLWRAFYHFLGVIGFTVAFLLPFKILLISPRPDSSFEPVSNSFPSGHATLSLAIFGFLAVLIGQSMERTGRLFTYLALGGLCVLIAATRVYLNFHWLTDVVGGTLIGLICLLIVTISYYRRPSRPASPVHLIMLALITVLIAFGWQYHQKYHTYIAKLTPNYWPTSTISYSDWWRRSTHTIPLYRTSRSGKPIEVLNIEWAGPLKDIEQGLLAQGWLKIPKLTLISMINRVSSDNDDRQLPLFPAFYAGHKPALVVFKPVDEDNLLLVISLWQAQTVFSDSTLPLWVGTISYQSPRNKFWHYKHPKRKQGNLIPATFILEGSLEDFKWKRVEYPAKDRPKSIASRPEWQGGVLLIKPDEEHRLVPEAE